MILYLDASSLVKLYVIEPEHAPAGHDAGWESAEVRSQYAQANNVFTSRITYAEARAALARRRRESYFANPQDYSAALRDLNGDWRDRIVHIGITESLVRRAGGAAERYALRGYDAVHLASALVLQQRLGLPVSVSTWDPNLRRAANEAGLSIAHQEATS
ncbi:MAG: type II toxin-antitoxin system VapC family toxin [Chloroflexi bacterium]|nr:type II toxin-antitoxin system VapC family toxin [Chloroflexota bacterium]